MTLEVYLDSETATGYVYNDDGKSYQYESGAVSKTKLTATFKNGEVLINATHQGEANLQRKSNYYTSVWRKNRQNYKGGNLIDERKRLVEKKRSVPNLSKEF